MHFRTNSGSLQLLPITESFDGRSTPGSSVASSSIDPSAPLDLCPPASASSGTGSVGGKDSETPSTIEPLLEVSEEEEEEEQKQVEEKHVVKVTFDKSLAKVPVAELKLFK